MTGAIVEPRPGQAAPAAGASMIAELAHHRPPTLIYRVAQIGHGGHLTGMSVQFAYRFQQDLPSSNLRDLDDVVLTVAVMSDDGLSIPAGTEGTIVSVFRDGEAYVVEFAQPEGTLASVGPDEIRLVERAAL